MRRGSQSYCGNRVAKLVLPDVATTLQMLINKQSLPVKLGKLEKPDGGITGGIDFTKELRGVSTKELARAGYLGALIEDGNNESLTFVVVDQFAQEFPAWVATATRPWFRQWQLDLVRFYAEVENFQGTKGVILGEPTLQILRQQAGIKVAS